MDASLSKEQLLAIVERIERLEKETAEIAAGIKEIYTEAKSAGFDPKYIKQCIKLRAKDPDELAEEDEVLKMYRDALGI
jgi:uncharacterized protein (UPF0335 family)